MPGQTNRSKRKKALLIYFTKFKGQKRSAPLVRPAPLDILITLSGSFLAFAILSILSLVYLTPVLATPLGATAVLVFGAPDAPLSQPRNVILGHALSAIIGVATYQILGTHWWTVTLGTSSAILVMLLTKTTHPPGGATAMFAILNAAKPIYIVTPIIAGSLLLILMGLLVNNLSPNRNYPRYWY
ncbi:HPP family protein [Desulfosporosinus sp. PR]|uniref:HPP family protein n=1 Tax=Candidatus Desulfosporosinus nitrosoreducens TaxID=3401928 RepID=UPI0027FFC7B4|nr:HPP family protein [Desulfosporosinus sp. PR]MDQ7097102.1 HPP family protein [Desulfosporosinus sp. PR]